MRRRLPIVAGLAIAAAAALLLLAGGRPASEPDYRVDAIFDHARGLIPGQLVEVAGGRVGKIEDVSLTADNKARIQMKVDGRFAPFRADATCEIRPQGLIAENYVQCDPGTPRARALRGRDGKAPTVGVQRTREPVNLTDLFQIWNVPTRDRLSVLVSQLGLATAGRGQDLNAILRRANPTLATMRRLMDLLERQRDQVAAAVDSSDAAVAGLAGHERSLRRLLVHAAGVTTRTGRRSTDLARAIHELPPLLSRARPALRELDAVAEAGTPLLAQAHRAAPAVTSLTRDVVPLARAAGPALRASGPVLDRGARVILRARPLTRQLRTYAGESLEPAKVAGRLLPNLRDTGFSDNLLRFFYFSSLATAWFDDTSHILPAHILTIPCAMYSTKPVDGCNANYTQRAAARRSRRGRRTHAPRRPAARAPEPSAPQAPAGGGPPTGPADPPARKPGLLPELPPVKLPPVEVPKEPLAPLLDYLLG